jgi:hypothetical protein
MNLFDMANVLRAEKEAGITLEAEIIERIDAHIRDLMLFKAWVRDSMEPRHMALGGMLGMEPEAPATEAETKDEAAEQ